MAPLTGISTISRTRRLLAALAALVLAGCGSEQSDMRLLIGAAREAFSGSQAAPISLKQASAVPFASMGVRVDDGPEVLIVLVTDSPHSRLWTAGKTIAIQTDDGRIVRTSGLDRNISGITGDAGVAVSPVDALHRRTYTRTLLYDFADLNAYSVKTVCTITKRGNVNIEILGKAIPTIRIEESCRADALRWSFVNTYWVGVKSGLTWQSVQHIHPRLGAIATEILRPPQSPS